MDVYKLLQDDHRKVKTLLKELDETTERAEKTREHLIRKIEMELTVHSEAEEKFFYPLLQGPKATKDLAYEALAEHKVVKQLLSELVAEPKGTSEWTAKASVLKENVEHHIEEEESELFPQARKILSQEEAESIGEEVEDYKEEHAGVGADS